MKLLLLITDQHSEVGVEGCAHFEVGHANRSLRSTDVNTVGGKLGLFSCESLLEFGLQNSFSTPRLL